MVISDHIIKNQAFINDRGLDPLPNISSRHSLANMSILDRSQMDPGMSNGPQTIAHSPSKASVEFPGLAHSPSRSILSK